jgi:hypothetical protein
MTFPRHLVLSLSHNEHKANYETVAENWERRELDTDRWVSDEQRLKAYATGELWELQWYPDTPIGFCLKLAADLDVLLEWAKEYAADEAPAAS